MQGIVQKILANPGKYSVQELTQAMKSGAIPAYIAIPLIQQKSQDQKQMQLAQQAQGAQDQVPVVQQVMQEGISQLPSGLNPEGFAGGGIVAFSDGDLVEDKDASIYSGVNPLRFLPGLNIFGLGLEETPGERQRKAIAADYAAAIKQVAPTAPVAPRVAAPTPTPTPVPTSAPTSAPTGKRPSGIAAPAATAPQRAPDIAQTPEAAYAAARAMAEKNARPTEDAYTKAVEEFAKKREGRMEDMGSTARGLAALQAAAAMGSTRGSFLQGIGAAAGAFGSEYAKHQSAMDKYQDATEAAQLDLQQYRAAMAEGNRKEAFAYYDKFADNQREAVKNAQEAVYRDKMARAALMTAQAHQTAATNRPDAMQVAIMKEFGDVQAKVMGDLAKNQMHQLQLQSKDPAIRNAAQNRESEALRKAIADNPFLSKYAGMVSSAGSTMNMPQQSGWGIKPLP